MRRALKPVAAMLAVAGVVLYLQYAPVMRMKAFEDAIAARAFDEYCVAHSYGVRMNEAGDAVILGQREIPAPGFRPGSGDDGLLYGFLIRDGRVEKALKLNWKAKALQEGNKTTCKSLKG